MNEREKREREREREKTRGGAKTGRARLIDSPVSKALSRFAKRKERKREQSLYTVRRERFEKNISTLKEDVRERERERERF